MAKISKAAYYLVDLSTVPADYLKDILEDAAAGGGEYGVRVVEEALNGAARHPIYGVYFVDDAKWKDAQGRMELGELLDEEAQEAREEALRSQASDTADAEAKRQREEEEAAQRAITHEEESKTSTTNKAKR